MGRIWSEENKFRMWLEVEIAATLTLAEAGIVPQEAAAAIRDKSGFELARIKEVEAEVKHDVIAFTTAVAEKIGPHSRWLHYGLTSNDVVDTAQALQIKAASTLILRDLEQLGNVLKRRAHEFKHTPMIGRTHGIHAESITFGLKLANWYSEVQRDIERMERSAEEMRVGKLSGAVGTFAHLEPELEEKICQRLGLEAAAISSQVIQRDRHAYYVATLAVIACTLDKIATEIRHLQRTEVREAEEYFSEKMFVYPERMRKNLESTGGLVFSGQLLLDLAESGMAREDAYRLVQKHAMRAWQKGLNFRELAEKEKKISSRLSAKQLDKAFDVKRQLRNVDKIFARVFGKDSP